MQHRPEIDGLRAVAVLPVVLFHAGVGVFSGGYVGVDVFFVISGFLITGLIREDLERGRFTVLGFYNRRIRRILPALTFMAALTSVAAFVLLLPEFQRDFGRSLISVAAFASNFYFWKTSGYFDNDALLRPLLHTWSLAVEEQFYIFMPLFALAIHRWFGKRWIALIGFAAAASLALSTYAMQVGPTANFYLLPTRAWELLLGALLAGAPRRDKRDWLGQVLSLLGLGMIAWSVFAYNDATPFPGLTALTPCVGAALAIYFAHPQHTLAGRFLTLRPMIGIGLISYSLYLVHWPIAVFWRYLTLQPPGLWGAAAIAAMSVVLATISWKFVEQPFRRRGAATNTQVVLAGVSALVALAIIGGAGLVLQTSSPPQTAQAHVETAEEAAGDWRNGRCFFEDGLDFSVWRPEACVINPGGQTPVLLWGDSFAAHYVPGLMAVEAGGPYRIYQYTAAGCPPALDYFSYARPNCTRFNANALHLIDELGIRRVILSARWIDLRHRGLGLLRSTLDALEARGVEVYVVGQSPIFLTSVQVIGARRDGRGAPLDAWTISLDPRVNRELRGIAGDARFIDPVAALCRNEVCPFRSGREYLFWDYGHFSTAGSIRAARTYLPLGADGGSRTRTP